MKYSTLLIFGLLLLSSCASVLNKSHTRIAIRTNSPAQIVIKNDTIPIQNNKIVLKVPRSKEDLRLKFILPDAQQEIQVSSVNSANYYLNIFNYGIGFWWERKNPKRYGYARRVFVDLQDTLATYAAIDQKLGLKKQWLLHLSIPYINHFFLHPDKEEKDKNNPGFLGISLGAEYFYKKNRSFSLNGVLAINSSLPIPAAVNYSDGEFEFVSTAYLALNHNHQVKRFDLGYGLSLSKNIWNYRYFGAEESPPPSREPARRVNIATGLNLTGYYRLGKSFHLGLIYRPTFIRFNSEHPFRYEHFISLDLKWKIRLKG